MVLATRNPGKIQEFRRLLAPAGWELVGLDDAGGGRRVGWEEDGPDYRSNAAIKARTVAGRLGAPALGDDSGFEIAALGGWPGPRSARWLGPAASDQDRLEALLGRLAGLPEDRREASFVCALALAEPLDGGGATLVAEVERRVEGSFLVLPRGRGGFGYDPVFVPAGGRRTTAEMAPAEKDRVSHRGAAARALLAALGVGAGGPAAPRGRRAPRRDGGGPPPDQVVEEAVDPDPVP